jgi:hypothetical protein
VEEASRSAVSRVSRRSTGWWRTPTERQRTRADAVAGLVATIAAYEQAVEIGAGPAPETFRRPPPPARPDVLADQLAVVTYDLGLALAAKRAGDPATPADGRTTVARVAARALADLLVVTYEVDPRPVPAAQVEAALAGEPGPLGDLLERLPRLGDG